MKKSTNIFILKYALLPMLIFIMYAYFVPESIKGTQSPMLIHWIAQILWVPGCVGVFVFWAWGVMANFSLWLLIPLNLRWRGSGPGRVGGLVLHMAVIIVGLLRASSP